MRKRGIPGRLDPQGSLTVSTLKGLACCLKPPGTFACLSILINQRVRNNPMGNHQHHKSKTTSPRGLSTFVTDFVVITWVVLLAPLSKFETQVSRGSDKSLSRLGSPAPHVSFLDEVCFTLGSLSVEKERGLPTACTHTRGTRGTSCCFSCQQSQC